MVQMVCVFYFEKILGIHIKNPQKIIAMKNLLVPACLVLLLWSCNLSEIVSKSHGDRINIADSTEYEITISDPGFDTWYLMHFSPSNDYSNEYYHSKNLLAVSNWNDYFIRGRHHQLIDTNIYYDCSLDYGIDVNRKLYWYFKYAEEKSGIRLLK